MTKVWNVNSSGKITIGTNDNWDAAYLHKTTEDAITGVVKVNGLGTYAAGAFIDLSDVPNSYVGNEGNYLTANATEDGLVFYNPADNIDRLESTNSTLILSDDATDQTLTGNLGDLIISPDGDFCPTKSQDMIGGASCWFRPPQMADTDQATMVTSWDSTDAGKMWFNTDTDQYMAWDGTALVIIA